MSDDPDADGSTGCFIFILIILLGAAVITHSYDVDKLHNEMNVMNASISNLQNAVKGRVQ